VRVYQPFIAPHHLPPATPTLLQHYCTPFAQYTALTPADRDEGPAAAPLRAAPRGERGDERGDARHRRSHGPHTSRVYNILDTHELIPPQTNREPPRRLCALRRAASARASAATPATAVGHGRGPHTNRYTTFSIHMNECPLTPVGTRRAASARCAARRRARRRPPPQWATDADLTPADIQHSRYTHELIPPHTNREPPRRLCALRRAATSAATPATAGATTHGLTRVDSSSLGLCAAGVSARSPSWAEETCWRVGGLGVKGALCA